jgi:hypothetical protein
MIGNLIGGTASHDSSKRHARCTVLATVDELLLA